MRRICDFLGRPSRDVCRCVALTVAIGIGILNPSIDAAAAPVFSAILGGSGQDYAAAVSTDSQGNTYVAGLTYSPDFHVTPGALQVKAGGASDAFVAKFSGSGTLLWCTYLGGSGDDYATGVAVDSSGNVVVTGWTRSLDFPVLHPLAGGLNGGLSPYRWDAFVTKLDPNGTKLLYSIFVGGSDDDGADGLALDAAGNAYITGDSNSSAGFTGVTAAQDTYGVFVAKVDPAGALAYVFFHPYQNMAAAIAVDSAGSAYVTGTRYSGVPANSITKTFGPAGQFVAVIFKLSPDGSHEIYETSLGGSIRADGLALTVDPTGAAYVAGSTTSTDFPLVRPLQSTLGARPLWKSTDSGITWTPLDGLPFAFLQSLVVDPTAPNRLYATAPEGGFFRSSDGGATWSKAANGITNPNLGLLAIDPLHPQTLFTGTSSGTGTLFRTADGGDTWSAVDSQNGSLNSLALDPQKPNNVYPVWNNGAARQSSDGGATWRNVPFPGSSIAAIVVDPSVSGSLFAYSAPIIRPPFGPTTPPYVWHSADGGATWVQGPAAYPDTVGLFVDGSTNPSTIYAGVVLRSADGGQTWSPPPPSPAANPNTTALAVDPAGTLYTAVFNTGIFTSHDHGTTWTPVGTPLPPSNYGIANSISAIVPASIGTLYAVLKNTQSSGFVSKLSPDGSSLVFSTLFNGHVSPAPILTYAAEPQPFLTQNWVSAITLDASGNVVIAGGTRASDLPTVNALQPANAGRADAFAATLAADGSKLIASTYLGGSQDDAALAVTADAQGNVILVGQTWSLDFPVPGGVHLPAGLGEAFVVKLPANAPPVITSVVNGASLEPGIEAGSWVAIRGNNLANTNPGRTWRADEVVNGVLPTSLDRVSVTIDGKAAFVYYISPTQINVQAPSDAVEGVVTVVVHNNGSDSVAFAVPLAAFAPAFFLNGASNFALASRLPDYAPVGDPAVIPGAVAAKPGDLVALWGTGFGATAPPTTAGTVVSGSPPVAGSLTVTVGGLAATVVSGVLSAGAAGLYQITIQLPGGVPSGTAAVRASIGGVTSPAGISIFVGQ